MNPVFDLIVIGLIVSMVVVNLYYSREATTNHPTWKSMIQKKWAYFFSSFNKTPVPSRPSFQ